MPTVRGKSVSDHHIMLRHKFGSAGCEGNSQRTPYGPSSDFQAEGNPGWKPATAGPREPIETQVSEMER